MQDKIFYLPVRLIAHNGGTGSHSYFAVRPVDRDPDAEPWPLFLSPDSMHLLYIHPSQLHLPPSELSQTLEEHLTLRGIERQQAEFGAIAPRSVELQREYAEKAKALRKEYSARIAEALETENKSRSIRAEVHDMLDKHRELDLARHQHHQKTSHFARSEPKNP
jgi:hypothetical protein